MADMNPRMLEQIKSARKQLRVMKKHAPYIFEEYVQLQIAQDRFDEAKLLLVAAKKQWNDLGKD